MIPNSPKIVKAAWIVAFIAAALQILSAFTQSIILLLFALIPIVAGIGIMQGRIWSAYGYALFQVAQVLDVPILLLRSGAPAKEFALIIATAVIGLALAALFFVAGRSLQTFPGSKPGWPLPWIALAALPVVGFMFVQAFSIPSGAMEDTLLIGDRILVQRFPKPRPSRNMIVVLIYSVDRTQTFVKRIIGMPGDRIHISNKTVYRNGLPLAEPYVVHRTDYVDSYRDNFPGTPNVSISSNGLDMLDHHVIQGEVIVPQGNYFVLGDNRDNSLDSRYWGFITDEDIIGKPLLIYDSQEAPTEGPEARSSPRFFALGRERWDRLLKIL